MEDCSLCKVLFLEEGKPVSFESLRQEFVFPALKGQQQENNTEEDKVIYLDAAGAALYTRTQVSMASNLLKEAAITNPHSYLLVLFICPKIACSLSSSPEEAGFELDALEQVRAKVLSFFGASEVTHDLVFCSSATAALKLIGENMAWSTNSGLFYFTDCHTSSLGIREYAFKGGSAVYPVDASWCACQWKGSSVRTNLAHSDIKIDCRFAMFVYPGECNFSGTQYSLDLSRLVHQNGLLDFKGENIITVVDGAKLAASTKICLDAYPDIDIFVASFYKIFGLPTGVACLMIRKDRLRIYQSLQDKCYYGGGTIVTANSKTNFKKAREGNSFHSTWEDGSLNFIDIIVFLSCSLHWLFETVGGMNAIHFHTKHITTFAENRLKSYKYPNGCPYISLYGKVDSESDHFVVGRGPILSFHVILPNGMLFGHRSLYNLCLANRVLLRAGALCNPGACQRYLQWTNEDIEDLAFTAKGCWDQMEFVNGKPTGVVRISFGLHTSENDITKFLSIITEFCEQAWKAYDTSPMQQLVWKNQDLRIASNSKTAKSAGFYCIQKIFVYPVRGCQGMEVTSWQLGDEGFLYDRKFCIVHAFNGKLISCKSNDRISLLKASLIPSEREEGLMDIVLEFPSEWSNRDIPNVYRMRENQLGSLQLHCWLSAVLQVPCQLVETSNMLSVMTDEGSTKNKPIGTYRNDAHLLVILDHSVQLLNKLLRSRNRQPVSFTAFRPNLVLKRDDDISFDVFDASTLMSLEEDTWNSDSACIRTNICGNEEDMISLTFAGNCVRCSTVCVDQESGQIRLDREPFLTLSTFRNGMNKARCSTRPGPIFGRLYNVIDCKAWKLVSVVEHDYRKVFGASAGLR
eukprot:jgi/Galph1/5479/GphlegSOOS_G4131.1